MTIGRGGIIGLILAGSFVAAYYIGPILMSLPAGTLADRWGIKRTLVLGQPVIGGGLVAVSASGSYAMVALCMVAAGFGYGLLNPTSTKAVIAWSPPARRATLVGLKQVGLPFGGALGAVLLPLGSVPGAMPSAPGSGGGSLRAVLVSRDLSLVAGATGIFAAMQTVWFAFLVLYLQQVAGQPLLSAARYLALAQVAGMTGRVAFGVLSDRLLAGGRRAPLAIAGCGSALCSLIMAGVGPGASPWLLAPLAFLFGFVGIGWNGVQHTLMAELAGPRMAGTAVGLGLPSPRSG